MKKHIALILLLVCISVLTVTAQKDAVPTTDGGEDTFITELNGLKPASATDPTSLLSAADLNEPDSFGGNAKFLGTAATGFVVVYHSCDPADLAALGWVLGPDDRCLQLNQPSGPGAPPVTTSGTFNNIGRIDLPKNSVSNVIYYIQQNQMQYNLANTNMGQVFSTIVITPSLTIVSDALNDPTAINPNTGLPYNGSMTIITSQKLMGKTYEINAQEWVSDRYTTSAVRGFARSFFADLGLPPNVINELYKKPMTIRLNLSVTANSMIRNGYFSYGIRFLGN